MPPTKRRQRGYIEQLPSGSWRAVVYAGVDQLTGKERRIRKTAKNKRAAEAELIKLLGQVEEGRQPKSDITVGLVVEKWLEVVELEDTTRQRYMGLIRRYIEPTFGSTAAAQLDAELLERFYARLRRCNRLCAGRSRDHECRPLSGSTVRAIHFILRASLDRAVRWRYLAVNQAALAKPPPFERPDPDPPSAAEVAALLNDAWRDPMWGMLLWLTMVSGCRRGEMCALRWTDVDLARGVLTVERSYAQATNGAKEKATKSHQKRRVALDAQTVALLEAYRENCEAECRLLGTRLPRDAFVFSYSPDGSRALLPSTVTQRYRRLAIRAGLRSTRIHALRHYSATELLSAGVNIRTVAGRLGHGSGGATTLRFYSAWVDEADRRAADAIAGIMPRPDPTRREPRSPYEKVAAELRAEIESERLAPGAPLPTAKELMAKHHVSAGTANRALALLKDAGLVTGSRGRRAIVVERPHS